MSVQQKFCCKDPKGEDIYLFTLTNKQGVTVSLTNYGAIISAFKIKMADGSFNDIVLGFDDIKEYLSDRYLKNYAYLGAACGRYANRIKNARFTLEGKEYQLTRNMGNDMLHGGKRGFDKKTWQVILFSESAIELKCTSENGEEGFPGTLQTSIRFELNDNNELSYEFSATTDKSTPVNLTHHSYFNLNNGEGTIGDHEIKIQSSFILAQDEGLVCNGDFIAVDSSMYDFRIFKAINMDWNKTEGYDQCFVIDRETDGPSLVAEAKSDRSGITLQILSTAPTVQFYTGQGLRIANAKNGIDYRPFSGFCLETHQHPNAINIPDFPNTVLRPGEKYYQKTVYRVIQEAK